MRKGVIFGTGGMGQLVMDHYTKGLFNDLVTIDYFYVDPQFKDMDTFYDRPVISNLDDLEGDPSEYFYWIAVMDIRARKKFARLANQNNMISFNIIHPNASIGSDVTIGKGCLIGEQSIIEGKCIIGDHVVIGSQTRIGHHTSIGDFSQISNQSCIGGYNLIGDRVMINTKACTASDITIAPGAILGMGACVFKDVPKGSVMIGNPAKSIRSKKALDV